MRLARIDSELSAAGLLDVLTFRYPSKPSDFLWLISGHPQISFPFPPSLFYLYFKARVKIKVFIDFLEFFFINKNLLNSHFTFRNKRQNLNKKNFLILISSFSIKIIIKWRVKIYFYYISLNQMWEANEGEIKDGDWKRSTKLWFFFFIFSSSTSRVDKWKYLLFRNFNDDHELKICNFDRQY